MVRVKQPRVRLRKVCALVRHASYADDELSYNESQMKVRCNNGDSFLWMIPNRVTLPREKDSGLRFVKRNADDIGKCLALIDLE